MAKTPWVDEGPLRARFWDQSTGSKLGTELVREVNQPDRDKIMANTQEMAKEGTPDLSFGRLVARIPIVDFYRLQKSHPDLFNPDADIARPAVVKFFNSTEGKAYRVNKA
ncbi:MAG: hypothetical protein V3W44_06990 [Dehalococcoidales bacterium]